MSGILLVRDVMTKSVKTVGLDSTVKEAVQKMNKFHIGSVVVMDSEKTRIQGILTERDILRLVELYPAPLENKVREVMSRSPVTIDVSTTIEKAAEVMARKRIKRLPVTDNSELVGIITSSDILRANPILVNALMNLLKA